MAVLLLDWRRETAGRVHGCSVVVADAAGALRLIEGVARAARFGEYRITRNALPPVYTSAPLIRAWRDNGGELPASLGSSLWCRESQRAIEVEALTAGLRITLNAAARRGLIPQSTVAAMVGAVEAATVVGQSGDALHGPLSR